MTVTSDRPWTATRARDADVARYLALLEGIPDARRTWVACDETGGVVVRDADDHRPIATVHQGRDVAVHIAALHDALPDLVTQLLALDRALGEAETEIAAKERLRSALTEANERMAKLRGQLRDAERQADHYANQCVPLKVDLHNAKAAVRHAQDAAFFARWDGLLRRFHAQWERDDDDARFGVMVRERDAARAACAASEAENTALRTLGAEVCQAHEATLAENRRLLEENTALRVELERARSPRAPETVR